jgi:hypothetical protein
MEPNSGRMVDRVRGVRVAGHDRIVRVEMDRAA